ncbi:MAG: hypothetical protein JNM63_00020, partial [Spirochaetia bacterium]|nr:hypothetical protein [Spirochaetia bacterium]
MKRGAEKLDEWEAKGRTASEPFTQLLYEVAKDYAERGLYEWARERLSRRDFYDLIRPCAFGIDCVKLRLEVFFDRGAEDLFLYDLQVFSGWTTRVNAA